MKKLIAIFFLSSCFASLHAQKDCSNAIPLTGPVVTTDVMGAGETEIKDGDTKSLYWFEKEHNTAWFIITIEEAGDLVFEISPGNEKDDVDFLLLKYTGASFCDDVRAKRTKPVRTNLSRTYGKTGLSEDAGNDYVHSGPGEAFSHSLPVKKGEVYYLVIDHLSPQGGKFTLKSSVISGKKKEPSNIDAAPVKIEKKDLAALTVPLHVKIVDEETHQPVKAKLSIEGIIPGSAVKIDTSYFTADLGSSQSVHIECNAGGYLLTSESIMGPMIDPYDPAGLPPPVEVEIRLRKVKPGEKVALHNIQFQPDKAEFLPSSWADLQNLTSFLLTNPNVKIEIGGHVNGPDGPSRSGKKMSAKRAKAVYDYLLKRGIDKKRLKYKGYGNTQMIYPAPINERQAEENRRVEIKIISN